VLQNADLLINQSMDHPIWTQPILKKLLYQLIQILMNHGKQES